MTDLFAITIKKLNIFQVFYPDVLTIRFNFVCNFLVFVIYCVLVYLIFLRFSPPAINP